MAEAWLLFESGAGPPAWNMAWDEALLACVASFGKPVLRFYSWLEPAATFGYFQKYAAVEHWTELRPLLRRPTGGGLVAHLSDWTYSVAIPPQHPWYALKAADSYQRIHFWIRDSLAQVGLHTELAPVARKEGPGRCFLGPEQFDLVQSGKKLGGAAQRRSVAGLLIQGSIQPPPAGVPRGRWEAAMVENAAQVHGVEWQSLKSEGAFKDCAAALLEAKYSCEAYHQKR